ncbi:hypothetical protein JN535_08335 [Cellulosimicrobium cellulans]|nr:hypothetical protein [Cellulosimicrobium cellulans]
MSSDWGYFMKQKLAGLMLGAGLVLGLAVAPVGAAHANGGVTCPSGRTVSFTSSSPFKVRVYPPQGGQLYSSTKVGTQYRVYTGRQSILEWHAVSGSPSVSCAA